MLSPKREKQIADLYRQYPGLRNIDPLDDKAAIEEATDFMADNLDNVMERMPDELIERSEDWYNGYNRISQEAADMHGTSPEQAGAIIAVNSPKTDWDVNLSRADRIMDTWNTRQDYPWDEAMDAKLDDLKGRIADKQYTDPTKSNYTDMENVRGKKLKDLNTPAEKAVWIRAYDMAHNPRDFHLYNPDGSRGEVAMTKGGKNRQATWANMNHIEKAVSILEDGSPENISRQLGTNHKVRSFYRNSADPNEPTVATMDTHAIATALMRPLGADALEVNHNFGGGTPSSGGDASTGIKGTYPVNQDAYQAVARKRGVPARAIQSPTWVYGKDTMMGKKGKNYKDMADETWARYEKGEISQAQARDIIISAFEGK